MQVQTDPASLCNSELPGNVTSYPTHSSSKSREIHSVTNPSHRKCGWCKRVCACVWVPCVQV